MDAGSGRGKRTLPAKATHIEGLRMDQVADMIFVISALCAAVIGVITLGFVIGNIEGDRRQWIAWNRFMKRHDPP